MKSKLLDRILLAAVRWRLTRRPRGFAEGVAALLVKEINTLKGPLQRCLDDFEREEKAKVESARLAAAIDKFKSFESGNGLRLQ